MTVMAMATAMAPLGTLMRGFSRRGSSNSGGSPPKYGRPGRKPIM